MKRIIFLLVFTAVVSLSLFSNNAEISRIVIPKPDQDLDQAVVNRPISTPKDASTLLVPWDDTFILAMTPNDDASTGVITLGFNFSLYGSIYNQCWINNNGNVSFDGPYGTYSAAGFPYEGYPMVAPFWADVDTRGTGSVWYKLESNRMIVIWDAVGYYNSQTDKVNTFELVITNGTDPTIGIGNTAAFSYADMAWTTGSASGGSGGFGGTPANVGINKGDNISYAQIGRFDHAGTDYDGPYDNNDGVDWLDNQLFLFDTGAGSSGAMIVIPSTVDIVIAIGGYPTGTNAGDPGMQGFIATYPGPGSQTIVLPVGPGLWRGWAWYNSMWNMADVFPLTGPGDLTWSNVPFGAKSDVPLLIVNDQTLPVELSSFTAVVTGANFVNLAWVTESETSMSGYRVYRNESADFNTAFSLGFEESSYISTQHIYSFLDYEVETGHTYYYWLQAQELDGSNCLYGPVMAFITETITPVLPAITVLGNAYPNPFRNQTNIDVTVKEGDTATVTIYNIMGQAVRSYQTSQGTHSLKWDGLDMNSRPCSSGIYLYKLSSPSFNQTKKLMLIK